MGNRRFKLSHIIPNAWLYKLKDLTNNKQPKAQPLSSTTTTTTTKVKKSQLPPPPPPSSPPSDDVIPPLTHSQPRKSYHITRGFPQNTQLSSPRKTKHSKKSANKIPTNIGHQQFSLSTTVSGGCTCKTTTTFSTHRSKPLEFSQNDEKTPVEPDEKVDIFIDVNECKQKPTMTQLNSEYLINGFSFNLPKIITKPEKPKNEDKPAGSIRSRRLPVYSPSVGVRLKLNSPRIMRKLQGQNGNFGSRKSVKKRRSISGSLAVVKSSDDPQRDFRESMVEMIVQNNLRGSKDLEDLLACYLSLNSDEYHDVIIKVFKQIWYDLSRDKNQKSVS